MCVWLGSDHGEACHHVQGYALAGPVAHTGLAWLTVVHARPGHSASVDSITYIGVHNAVATASKDGTVRVWGSSLVLCTAAASHTLCWSTPDFCRRHCVHRHPCGCMLSSVQAGRRGWPLLKKAEGAATLARRGSMRYDQQLACALPAAHHLCPCFGPHVGAVCGGGCALNRRAAVRVGWSAYSTCLPEVPCGHLRQARAFGLCCTTRIRCVQHDSASPRWPLAIGLPLSLGDSSWARGQVLCGSEDPHLQTFSAFSGDLQQSVPTSSSLLYDVARGECSGRAVRARLCVRRWGQRLLVCSPTVSSCLCVRNRCSRPVAARRSWIF